MKQLIFFISFIISQSLSAQWQGPSVNFAHGRLKVAPNSRYLVYEDGTPFFYLGDTGWELFHRLTKEDAEQYLENRRSKGFTVIQAVVLAELDGLNTPNAYGEKPLVNNDPLKPNEKYFKHVDWVIEKAKEKGLFIGLLPTWGDKIDKQWGVGPVIFNKENIYKYGEWLARRYKDVPNIIWINGGDRSGGGANTEVFDALGKAIKSVDKNHLMTFHPMGEHSSAEWFHTASWLDFNMTQTGHCQRSYAAYQWLLKPTWMRIPEKPCMDGEPRYEDHPVCWKPEQLGWFNETDVRQAAYWNMLSGACGFTYGCHPIWQFADETKERIGMARHTWKEVLDLPGAQQMIHLRKFFESRTFTSLEPDDDILMERYIPETDHISAARGDHFVVFYTPTGHDIELDLGRLNYKRAKASWFDPKTGEWTMIEILECVGIKKFAPPVTGWGNDRVLVLDEI